MPNHQVLMKCGGQWLSRRYELLSAPGLGDWTGHDLGRFTRYRPWRPIILERQGRPYSLEGRADESKRAEGAVNVWVMTPLSDLPARLVYRPEGDVWQLHKLTVPSRLPSPRMAVLGSLHERTIVAATAPGAPGLIYHLERYPLPIDCQRRRLTENAVLKLRRGDQNYQLEFKVTDVKEIGHPEDGWLVEGMTTLGGLPVAVSYSGASDPYPRRIETAVAPVPIRHG